MNLTIDVGNTSVKIVVFDDTIPVYRFATKRLTQALIAKLFRNYPITHSMISSVVDGGKEFDKILRGIPGLVRLTSSVIIPLKNRYGSPKTLGSDRLANAVAGSFLFPRKNVLVIDAGTCIKYDFVNSRREYLGGGISPGMEMRFRALNAFTGKLPLVKDMSVKKLIGSSTVESIQSGVMIGIAEEIKGLISLYKKKHTSLQVILTGGDASRFEGELNLSIFAAVDLVNIGLNEIISHNTRVRK